MSENLNKKTKKRLFLIDGSSYIYRAFFALPHLSNSKGVPTNAVYGYTAMLLKVMREETPDYLAVAFDSRGPTFRHEVYKEYKANRPSMPDNLVPQIPFIHDITAAFNLPVLSKEGVEADDIIGTLAKKAANHDLEVVIVTGDKDMMQLVTNNITILDTMKNKVSGHNEVLERFGVGPENVRDVMGLMGDSSDNIPGVAGVGEKTAVKLMAQYGSLEKLYENMEEIKGKLKDKLEKDRDIAFLSRELATIDCNLDFDFKPGDFEMAPFNTEKLRDIFKELELSRFIKELAPSESLSREKYRLLTSIKEIKSFLSSLKKEDILSIDLETTSLNTMEARIVGISLSREPHLACYIPLAHSGPEDISQPETDEVLQQLQAALTSEEVKKAGHNLKYDYSVLCNYGIEMKGIYCDTMIASYLLHPGRNSHSLEEVSREFLDHQMITYAEVTGDPKKVTFDQVSIEKALDYAGEDADVVTILAKMLLPLLIRDGFEELFHKTEIPLLTVLAKMERTGVKIDTDFLGNMSQDFEKEMTRMEGKIYELAGDIFNINSPKQLGEILFEKLKLPTIKKTKTGFSTNVEVLTKLAEKHDLPARILEYRSIAKLKSTYVDALPRLVNEKTGRVHTSYNQTVTSTGRLSSSDPNLQNIPIKTELGRKIREAFIPEEGSLIFAADYSQVELRIMAHLSEDPVLIKSFEKGEDIHRRTAAEVFGIFPEMVTDRMRREAKAINFGIIYGMSAFGLSKELSITPKVAKAYIDGYFQKYKEVRRYLDMTIESARAKGYVTTIMNRRCYVPDINSPSAMQRQFAERAAINAPIQGSAADIIKVAMVRISDRLKKEGHKAKMIMQVHDELVFEIPEVELEIIKNLVIEEMEGVVQLKAPLKVDTGMGRNWAEAH
ncbi:MAG: DNA polymerase I [Deltaproteobacteria bacterium]|nr:DNA polymerase I [Deltaproteobacteria bacterium]